MNKIIKKIEPHVTAIVLLVFLFLVTNRVYSYISPNPSLIKAELIGITALLAMLAPFLRKIIGVNILEGFLPVFSAALFGTILAQTGVIVPKTRESTLVHIGILAAAYVLVKIAPFLKNRIESGKRRN